MAVSINESVLDDLLKNYQTPEEIIGENGLLKQLTKVIVERALNAELQAHLGYEKHSPTGNNTGNSRNGHSKKTIKGGFGTIPVEVPRDRNGDFEPQIIQKNQTRFDDFDKKIISLYARGMTTREVQEHLKELYGTDVSPTLISSVTDAVMDEARAWHMRPLDSVYPIVFFDALRIRIKENGRIYNKAVHLVLGITIEGNKDLLGVWIAKEEGAKFWLRVLNDLQNRGVQDIFITCMDGLKGFPEAIESVFPKSEVQLCVVHQVRNSLKFVSWKERKEVAGDLKTIYGATTMEEAEINLVAFAEKWDEKYPSISQSWQRNWENLITFFAYPPEIRRVIYTTNPIESVNRSLRKVIKNRGSFPNDDSALKLIYLAMKNISAKWTMPIHHWKEALNQFSILCVGRMPED